MIEFLLAIPILTAVLCFFMNQKRAIEIVSTMGAGALLVGVLLFVFKVLYEGPIYEGALFMDALSAYVILIVAFMVLIGAIYSVGYMGHEFEEKQFGLGRLPNKPSKETETERTLHGLAEKNGVPFISLRKKFPELAAAQLAYGFSNTRLNWGRWEPLRPPGSGRTPVQRSASGGPPVIFTSSRYLVFLAGTLLLLGLVPGRDVKKRFLAMASCFFYAAWDWRYLGLLLAISVIDYCAAARIAHTHREPERTGCGSASSRTWACLGISNTATSLSRTSTL